jgi:23S rRNA (cytosine1962-C5)-methyltransferase
MDLALSRRGLGKERRLETLAIDHRGVRGHPAVMLDDRGVLHLAPGKDATVRKRHPWVFAGSIARVEGRMEAGDTVVVVSSDGERLGRAAFSPTSQIRARMWTYDTTTAVNAKLMQQRLATACAFRDDRVFSATAGDDTDGARLVFAENDGLPGMVIDQYGDVIVMQPQSAGAERIRPMIIEALKATRKPSAILVRADAEVRAREGLVQEVVLAHGTLPSELVTREHGMRLLVDPERGHKTGFYLDQRDSRARIRQLTRQGDRVLNCFSYTGGFSIAALMAGAGHVTSVDSSQPALDVLQRNVVLNGLDANNHRAMKDDCNDAMKKLHAAGERFDIVILDPPKFAPSAAHRDKALRAYGDLITRGLMVLKPGGLIAAFSCSGAVSRDDFAGAMRAAALRVGREVAMVGELGHAMCHPVSSSFPEGAYLKGLLGRVVD